MKTPLRFLVATLLLAASIVQAQAPRELAGRVAKAISDNYYDAERGQSIADELTAAAERGEFDALTDPRDLATALSERLRPQDQHFAVRWSNEARTGPRPGGPAMAGAPTRVRAAPGMGMPPGVQEAQRRGNFGLRRVEVQPGNVGYIDLREFANFRFGQADAPARLAIDAALQMVSGTEALIIDLRDNGGGSPAMVGYLSSAFTPKDANIYNSFRSREGTHTEAPRDWHASPRLDVPLYILISGRTGSAAEAFAYTLKNAGRATIVGEASGGAANPGGEIDLGDGLSVFVSTGSPVSPITGGNWEGTGVIPNVEATPATAPDVARRLALEAIIKRATSDAATLEARWSLEAMQAEQAPVPLRAADYAGDYGSVVIAERDGHLHLQRERRPAWVLVPQGNDAFHVAGEPTRRVIFERDATGAVIALEVVFANGPRMRYRR